MRVTVVGDVSRVSPSKDGTVTYVDVQDVEGGLFKVTVPGSFPARVNDKVQITGQVKGAVTRDGGFYMRAVDLAVKAVKISVEVA